MATPRFTFIKNASVRVFDSRNASNELTAIVFLINDEFKHTFDKNSGLVRAYAKRDTTRHLEKRLQRATFFFYDNELIDFRTADYSGYVQNEATLKILSTVLGSTSNVPMRLPSAISPDRSAPISLHKQLESYTFTAGGDAYNVGFGFSWSPFSKNIQSRVTVTQVETGLVHLVTADSMRMPVVTQGDWLDSLPVVIARQMSVFIEKYERNFKNANGHKASVATVMKLHELSADKEISGTTCVYTHNTNGYTNKVFSNKHLASKLPSHLTALEAYQYALKLMHSPELRPTSVISLQRMANDLVIHMNDSDSQLSFAKGRDE